MAAISTWPFVSGCSVASAAPEGPEVVTILSSATANEPRPTLTSAALDVLTRAANSHNGIAIVISADGSQRMVLPLTPRRADSEVEHGLMKRARIQENLRKVIEAVAAMQASEPGLDLLDPMDRVTDGLPHGTLIVISNGLSTAGAFDLRQVGWNDDPAAIPGKLARSGLLPNLEGWHVLWIGLNQTAGNQPKLTQPIRTTNYKYWRSICEATGASSCTFDMAPIDPTPPTTITSSHVVPVPEVRSITGPQPKWSVPTALFGFSGDSAVLGLGSEETLARLSASIVAAGANRPDVTVTITGFTADPPGATYCQELALARARAVVDGLRAMGILTAFRPLGFGVPQGQTAMRNGVFDETVADQMRRVEVEVSN
ncbi:MAG: OmpA family protein [Thermomicrobiales bacterium]